MFLQLKAEIDAIKSIKNNIEKIEEIYLKADTCLDDNEYLQLTNFVKSKIILLEYFFRKHNIRMLDDIEIQIIIWTTH